MNKYVTELIGTFFLVLTIGCTGIPTAPGVIPPLAIGSALMVMIFAGGHISGAHYNPAVTLAVWLRGKAPTKDVIPYMVSQVIGAALAAIAVGFLYGSGRPMVINNVPQALVAEFLFTFALAYVVLNVATAKGTANNSFYGLAIGFTVLTRRTALFGNQTGIRRALDRIKGGTAKRELPPWAAKVLNPGAAPFAFGSNLKENPVPNALRSKLPFLDGVETLAVVGNFAPPGVNLAGTLVYPDETAAKTGAAKVAETRAMLDTYTPFLALIGIPQPVRKLDADAVGKEGHFVAGIDAVAFSALLSRLDDLLGALPKAQPQPVSQ